MTLDPTIYDILEKCPDLRERLSREFPEHVSKPLTWPQLEPGELFRFKDDTEGRIAVRTEQGIHFLGSQVAFFMSSAMEIIRCDRKGNPL
jgi:hypothetical protein